VGFTSRNRVSEMDELPTAYERHGTWQKWEFSLWRAIWQSSLHIHYTLLRKDGELHQPKSCRATDAYSGHIFLVTAPEIPPPLTQTLSTASSIHFSSLLVCKTHYIQLSQIYKKKNYTRTLHVHWFCVNVCLSTVFISQALLCSWDLPSYGVLRSVMW
jgi:hypothetical protein